MQLFLFHFAGGSTYSYDFLKKKIDNNMYEFIPLELPGRGKRLEEILIEDKQEAIFDYIKQVKSHRNGKPYIIYGHSMGATLGLYVTKHMEIIQDPPCQLIVSGNPGPGVKEYDEENKIKEKRYLMNDVDFKNELRDLGGVPEEVLQNDELYSFFSPIMRADFKILETGEGLGQQVVLNTPILAMMGTNEKNVEQIENWEKFTSSVFESKILEGDHFFIHKYPNELIELFTSYYEKQFQL